MLAADYFDLAESLKMGRTFKGDETTALPVQLLIKLACRYKVLNRIRLEGDASGTNPLVRWPSSSVHWFCRAAGQ